MTKSKCESCKNFISHVTVVDNKTGIVIFAYGCMLGGNYIKEKTFFEGCEYERI